MQEELELDYEAEANPSTPVNMADTGEEVEDEEIDDEDDNVTVTINSSNINFPTVAYIYNREDNTYDVTNSEIELKNRIDTELISKQLENCQANSHLRHFYELKQQYTFLQNVPVSQRINIPIFSDYNDDEVSRVLVVPFVIVKPTVHEVVYNLINSSWLVKPKTKSFKISVSYIDKYIEELNNNALFKSSKYLRVTSNYVGILSTSYFKIGKAKCLASITIGFFYLPTDDNIKFIDFITVNHANIKNFQHNEDQLKELIKKYQINKIFCWLPNYGTVHNTLYGNVYWFNKLFGDSHGKQRLSNLYGKVAMEKNFDTTTICVNSIDHSRHCSYCNMMRLAIRLFNLPTQSSATSISSGLSADTLKSEPSLSRQCRREFSHFNHSFTRSVSGSLHKTSNHVVMQHGIHRIKSPRQIGASTSRMDVDNEPYYGGSLGPRSGGGKFKNRLKKCSYDECDNTHVRIIKGEVNAAHGYTYGRHRQSHRNQLYENRRYLHEYHCRCWKCKNGHGN